MYALHSIFVQVFFIFPLDESGKKIVVCFRWKMVSMYVLCKLLFLLFCHDARLFYFTYLFFYCFAYFAENKWNDSESARLEMMHQGRNELQNRFIKFEVEAI